MDASAPGRLTAANCVTVLAALIAALFSTPSTALPLGVEVRCPVDGLFGTDLSAASCATTNLNQRASADVTTGELKAFQFGPGADTEPSGAEAGYVTRIDFLGATSPFTTTYTLTVDGNIDGFDGEMQVTVKGWLNEADAPGCIGDEDACFPDPTGATDRYGNDLVQANYSTNLFNGLGGALRIRTETRGGGRAQLLGGFLIELSVDLLVDPAEPTAFFSSQLSAFSPFFADNTTIDFFNTATASLGELPDGVTFTSPNGFLSAVIPIPAAIWLFASALGLLGWLKRRTA